jgi:DNA repair protein RecO (recombination protein O)
MQTYAFVLDSSEKGEYDRTYSLLTNDLGLIDAFAKSVRKSRSKLSGHLEPPNFCWVELVESQRGWQITSALEEKHFRVILASPQALRTIMQASFLLREFVPVSHPDDAVWELWGAFVAHLSNAAHRPDLLRGILAQFLLKLMAQLGFCPAPADLAPTDPRLREDLDAIVHGAWLEEFSRRDQALWDITKAIVGTARRLMR